MVLKKLIKIIICSLLALLVLAIAVIYLPQRFIAHSDEPFVPDYPRVELTFNTDYETIFLQTGLGRAAVDKLRAENNFDAVALAQNRFFTTPQIDCVPMFDWFTREDGLGDTECPDFADLQMGDVLVTLSTHSFGWRHGHAAIVIDEYTVLECQQMGTEVSLEGIYYWTNYSNWAVLRPKSVTKEQQEAVCEFGLDKLKGKPYNILSGIFGPKAPDINDENTGFYCTNLIWYAWNNFGLDLDSDGGKIVTAYDLLHSDELEVVQLYGMDPRDFIN